MDINTEIITFVFALENLRMNKMQQTSAVAVSAILSECAIQRKERYVWIKPESK